MVADDAPGVVQHLGLPHRRVEAVSELRPKPDSEAVDDGRQLRLRESGQQDPDGVEVDLGEVADRSLGGRCIEGSLWSIHRLSLRRSRDHAQRDSLLRCGETVARRRSRGGRAWVVV